MNRVAIIVKAKLYPSIFGQDERGEVVRAIRNSSDNVGYIVYNGKMERLRGPRGFDAKSLAAIKWTPCCNSFKQLVLSLFKIQGYAE